MGTSFNHICLDCKCITVLGYGSYGTWLKASTLEEYDSLPNRHKDLSKNRNLRRCLKLHYGHNQDIYDPALVVQKDDGVYDDGCGYVSDVIRWPNVHLKEFDVIDMGKAPVRGLFSCLVSNPTTRPAKRP